MLFVGEGGLGGGLVEGPGGFGEVLGAEFGEGVWGDGEGFFWCWGGWGGD